MSRIKDRQKAIELRKQGKTYTQIREILGISKSTLSDWLSKYPLTEKQIEILQKTHQFNRQIGIEKTRIVKQKKREARIKATYENQKTYWDRLSKRELEIAGTFLYWGEGAKNMKGPISINNTDPEVLKFALFWMIHGLEIPKEKIKITLHLYKDMNIQKEMSYWSSELKLPLSQFAKPYIKESTRINLTHKGFGHGTCGLLVSNILLKERIMMAIKAISDYHGAEIEAMI